ncbi:MAG: MFS transporter, partial [Bryobacteraceae bacterium]
MRREIHPASEAGTLSPDALARAYRPWQVRIFAATWLAYAGYYFCRKPFYVAKADMGAALGFSSVELAHLGTAYLAAYAAGQFSSAFFGRVLGPKMLLVVGIAISVACNFVFGASSAFWTLLVFLALNGLAQGTGWPGCIGSLAHWFRRRERGSVLGVWSTCYQAGSLVSTALAAWLLGRFGWRWSYFGGALALAAIWVLVIAWHPNRPDKVGLPPIEEDEQSTAVPSKPGGREPLGWTADVVLSVLIMGLIYFTIKFLRYALWSWAPFFLRRNFGLAGDEAGY